jgi:type I restriction enzyme R subunit
VTRIGPRLQQTRAAVHSEIRFKLNDLPDEPYPQNLWDEKVEAVWQFVYGHETARAGASSALH